MIEVLFGESEAGSMKAAKNTVIRGVTDGPVSVWCAGKKKPPRRPPFAGWIEGTADEVICLGFMLDIGDIQESADSAYRKELIVSMYAQEQWEQDADAEKEIKETVDLYAGELLRLKAFLEDGEKIRIWYSDAPYSACGFRHLCRILQQYENEVYTVKLPAYRMFENTITRYAGWGEVSAEEFAGFLTEEKRLSRAEIRMYASFWNELVEENSPLRAGVNGKIMSVPEQFYDFQIWKRLTEKPVKECRLIGSILSEEHSMGDWWYAKRIEAYIRQGKIRVVEDAPKRYARMIRAECSAPGLANES